MGIDWTKIEAGTPIHIMVLGSSQLAYFESFNNGIITFKNEPDAKTCHDFKSEFVTLAEEGD